MTAKQILPEIFIKEFHPTKNKKIFKNSKSST